MITRAIRQAAKREEGQALVLACLMILILSIAVLSTVNLGHGIYERQRLQNTADAAAYSMAALEARAFNFYAFVNRTHVSHYVSAMVWQSILSFVYFVEAMVVDVLGVMKTIRCDQDPNPVIAAACRVIPLFNSEVARVYNFISNVFEGYKQLVRGLLAYLRQNDPDRAIGRTIIPTYYVMNALLTGSAEATMQAALQQVQSSSSNIVADNDRRVDMTDSRFAMGLLSACIMSRTSMREAWHTVNAPTPYGVNHFRPLDPDARRDNDKISRAKRAMGAVSNATRFALDRNNNGASGIAGPGWTTSRKLADLVDFPPEYRQLHELLVRYVDDPDAPGPVHLGKWGQTKLLTHSMLQGRNSGFSGGNKIRDWEDPPGSPFGEMAQGDDLGADDLYRINIGDWNQRMDFLGAGINNRHWFACRPVDPPEECWGDARYDPLNGNRLPTQRMLKTSIWAIHQGAVLPSIHYRLVHMVNGSPRMFPNAPGAQRPINWRTGEEWSEFGLSDVQIRVSFGWGPLATDITLHKFVANVRGVLDGNHVWYGVAPFPHFEPGQYARECTNDPNGTGTPSAQSEARREDEFNQPSTFAMLTKNADQMQNAGDTTGAGNARPSQLQGSQSVAFSRAGGRLVLDNTRANFLGTPGLHVISRGQTYYHRPGNWHEQPNFFNPYWKPRLASVLQGRYANPRVLDFTSELPAPLKQLPQKALTH